MNPGILPDFDMRACLRVLRFLPLIAIAACGSNTGAAGGDSATANAAPEPAGGAITMWTDSTELFMEHPALIVGAPDKFAVHLTDITDFAPLRSGKITLRFTPQGGGEPLVVVQDAPRSPGIYGPSPSFKTPGVYDLTILVNSPQAIDSITVPNLRVYASAAEAPKEERGGAEGIAFLKEQQWKTPGFRTEFAVAGSVAAAFDANGEIQPAAGRFAEVTAPISGLVDAGGVAASPVPGQRVARGQVMAYLTPTLGEGGSAFAEARAALREAEDEHARATRLFAVEAVPERRVHEAENRLRAAREALAGLGGGALSANGKIAVRAPIAGIIARRSIAPGTRVEAGAPLFTVVDPSVVWLEVNVPATQAGLVSRGSGAEFSLEGNARRYPVRRSVSVGSVIDSLSRTVPVLYEVANTDGSIKIGAAARVAVRTGQRAEGVMIPSSAILDEDGRAIVYVQAEGERFEKREVTIVGAEGTRVVVSAGIKAGERVVTGAAYQVRLASLSTAVPAHGHEH
jgi:membrane fusion protein, heavy metal efflux system